MTAINGGSGADVLTDIAGSNDTLRGMQGGDSYLFTAANGADTVSEDTGDPSQFILDRLVFNGRRASQLLLSRSASDLVVDQGNGAKVTVQAHFDTGRPAMRVEQLVDSSNLTFTLSTGLSGTANADILVGTGNSDTLGAAGGNDIVFGGAGNDTITGGAGDDLLYGGPGADRINGGNGNDTASYADATTAVTVNLAVTTAQNTGGGGTDTLTNIENLTGGSAGDRLTGDGSANLLQGLAGDDVLNGAGGSDTLIGGAGNDQLTGGAGTDVASYEDATSGVTVNLSLTTAQDTKGAGIDTLATIENLTGSAFDDTLTEGAGNSTLSGLGGNDLLIAGPGNDRLDGGAGIDTASYVNATSAVTVSLAITAAQATGGAGSDVLVSIENLTGSAFRDTLTGDNGNNTLDGGAGDDVLTGGLGNDILVGGPGSDTASYATATTAIAADLSLVDANGDSKATGAGTDTLRGIENLTGGSAADTLTGSDGSNVLTGNAGADLLDGRGGNDTLTGDAGDDILIGGAGNDSMNGGAGNDVFRYVATAVGGDVTLDTRDAIVANVGDHIDFSSSIEGMLFVGGVSLSADGQNTTIGSSFTISADGTPGTNVRFNSGHLQFDLDSNGAADFDVALSGVSSVTYNRTTDQFDFGAAAATKKIALTFDDGPDPTWTPAVLQALQAEGVKATFFELGEMANSYSQQTKDIKAAGHLIANHTFDHEDLTTLTNQQIRNEITSTQDALFAITGERPTYFRPPYGSIDQRVENIVEQLNLKTVLWTVDTEDWSEPGTDKIVSTALSQATDNGIILMHDGGGNRSQTVDAIDNIVDSLRAQGYEFVTIDQLPTLPPWNLFA